MSKQYTQLKEEKDGQADVENGKPERPVAWGCKPGAGQFEKQGYDGFTEEEKKEFDEGLLRAKWGIGQVSIRLPIRGCLQLVALSYGYIPFIIPIWWFVWIFMSWGMHGVPHFYPTYGLIMSVGFAILNETIIKQVCKKTLSPAITSRPPEAVCKHPGMPSGHVLNAYTIMVWTLLEVIFDNNIQLEWLLLVLVIMGPVPWARVYNKDHTIMQVRVSMGVATMMGIIAYLIRAFAFPGYAGSWPWDWEGYHVPQDRYGVLKQSHDPWA